MGLRWSEGGGGYISMSRVVISLLVWFLFVLVFCFNCRVFDHPVSMSMYLMGWLASAMAALIPRCCSSAPELAALVINCTFKMTALWGAVWLPAFAFQFVRLPHSDVLIYISGLCDCYFRLLSVVWLSIFQLPNGMISVAVLVYLRRRHVRKVALYNFCCKGLPAASLLGFMSQASTILLIENVFLAKALLLGCAIICCIGVVLGFRYMTRKRTRAIFSAVCFFIQCILSVLVAWHVTTMSNHRYHTFR